MDRILNTVVYVHFPNEQETKKLDIVGDHVTLLQIKEGLSQLYKLDSYKYSFYSNQKLITLSSVLTPDSTGSIHISGLLRQQYGEKSFPRTELSYPIVIPKFFTPVTNLSTLLGSSASAIESLWNNSSSGFPKPTQNQNLEPPPTPRPEVTNNSHSNNLSDNSSISTGLLNSIFSRDITISQVSQERYTRARCSELREEDLLLLDPQTCYNDLEVDENEKDKNVGKRKGPLQNLATEQAVALQTNFGERLESFTENFTEEDEDMIDRLCKLGYDRQTCETFLFMFGGDREKTEGFMSRYTSSFFTNSSSLSKFLEKLQLEEANAI